MKQHPTKVIKKVKNIDIPMQQKIKTIHIHSDHKFLFNSAIFEGEYFANEIFFLITDSEPFPDDKTIKGFTVLPATSEGFAQAVEACRKADIVVLYGLTQIKVKLALAVPHGTTVIWRFFGFELYRKEPEKYLSKSTLRARQVRFAEHPVIYVLALLKKSKLLYPLLSLAHLPKRKHEKKFRKAVQKIDYFLGIYREEYEDLLTFWPRLPAFKPLPRARNIKQLTSADLARKKKNDKPIIIVGNSKNVYNNHLDIINIIDNCVKRGQYQFDILFSYGIEGDYCRAVRQEIASKDYYKLIEQFMSKKEFLNYYLSASALVVNSYRQFAAGNIFIAIKSGVKLYLNPLNSHFKWLNSEGFKISTIDDFSNDLKTGNVSLSLKEARYNIGQYRKLKDKYPVSAFQKDLFESVVHGK